MITLFRKNYKITNVVTRILFVLTYVFSHWQIGLTATLLVLGQSNWAVAVATLAILGILLMFLLPPVVDVLLNFARIVSVPRAEYCLLAYAFCALGFLILGLLNLVNLFTPLLLVWGGRIFPFVSTAIACLGFYAVTSKLYFNNLTRAHYFKMFMIYALVFIVLAEVL